MKNIMNIARRWRLFVRDFVLSLAIVALVSQQVPVTALAEIIDTVNGSDTTPLVEDNTKDVGISETDMKVSGGNESGNVVEGSGTVKDNPADVGIETQDATISDASSAPADNNQSEPEPEKRFYLRLVTGISDDVVIDFKETEEARVFIENLERDGYKLLGWSTTVNNKDTEDMKAKLIDDDTHLLSWKFKKIEGEGSDAHEVEHDMSFAVKDNTLVLYAQWEEIKPEVSENVSKESKTFENTESIVSDTSDKKTDEVSKDKAEGTNGTNDIKEDDIDNKSTDKETDAVSSSIDVVDTDSVYSIRLLVGLDVAFIDKTDIVLGSYAGATLLGFDSLEALEDAEIRYANKASFVVRDGVFAAQSEDVSATDLALVEESMKDNPFEHAGSADVSYADVALIDTGAEGTNVIKAASVLGESTADDNGHGTEMLKTIVSENENVRVMSIKALDGQGHGTVAGIYAAIELAAENSIPVINLSLSAKDVTGNAAIKAAIADAQAAGCTVVAAAGNRGNDASFYTPGNIEGVLTIGAIDELGHLAGNSNWGEVVDGYVEAKSTSYAAARVSGHLSLSGTLDGWDAWSVLPRLGIAYDDLSSGDFSASITGTEGVAVAVLTSSGDLIFCRTEEPTLINNTAYVITNKTFTDISGNQYTGTVYRDIETRTMAISAGPNNLWSSSRSSIKTVSNVAGHKITPSNLSNWFYNCANLTTVNFGPDFDTSNVTNMSQMFMNCKKLTSLNISDFDTSALTNTSSMFRACTVLASFNDDLFVNSYALENVSSMFYGCTSLTNLDLSDMKTESLTTSNSMFYGCSALQTIDLTGFRIDKVTDIKYMFRNCISLTTIWCDSDWSLDKSPALSSHSEVFGGDTNLVGGRGTTFDSSTIDKSWARVDAGSDAPGYFSTKPTATITFNGNGATSGSIPSESGVAGKYKLPANVFVKGADSFLGWSETQDGSGTILQPGDYIIPTNANTTIYAIWGHAAQVTFMPNGGSGTMAPETALGTYTIPGSSFTAPQAGITFAGWNTVADGTGTAYAVGQEVTFNNDVTLYAQWSGQVRLSYNGNQEDSGSVSPHVADVSMQHFTMSKSFSYSGMTQTFVAPMEADYTFEVWGAQGGSFNDTIAPGGKGGYSRGSIHLQKDDVLYITVGGKGAFGISATTSDMAGSGYNGGGNAGYHGGGGGGATDIRMGGTSLSDRILVAGGGGGSFYYNSEYACEGGAAGGLSGLSGGYIQTYSNYAGQGGTQSAGGAGGSGSQAAYNGNAGDLGVGGEPGLRTLSPDYPSSGAGGGGYYGGGAGGNYHDSGARRGGGGGGGSGYADSSVLTSTVVSGGNTSFVAPDGSTETGHEGNGYVKITYEGDALSARLIVKPNGFEKADHVFTGWNTKADGTGDAYQPGDVYWALTDGILYAQWVSSYAGDAVAVIQDNGEMVLFRTTNAYTNNTTGTFTDIAGNQWTGRIFTSIESLGRRWDAYKTSITKAYVAPDQYVAPVNCANWFEGATNLESVDLNRLLTDTCTTMEGMFDGATSIEEVDMSMLDTSMCTTSENMFRGATSLTDVTLANDMFAASTNMSSMFEGCTSLETIDLSNLSSDAVTDVSAMFKGDTVLTNVTIPATFEHVTDFSEMFSGCSSIVVLDISSFDTGSATNMADMFNGDTSLRDITLGSDFNFRGDGSLSDANSAILPTHQDTSYTGSWMKLPHINPADMPVETSEELRDETDSTVIDGEWVWEPIRWIDITVQLEDELKRNRLGEATFTISPADDATKYVDANGVVSSTPYEFVTSTSNGSFSITKLRSGSYTVHQVSSTPMSEGGYEEIADFTLNVVDDYDKDDLTQTVVTMSGTNATAGVLTQSPTVDNVFTLLLTNHRSYDLPEVGGPGVSMLIQFGIAAGASATLASLRRKRKGLQE